MAAPRPNHGRRIRTVCLALTAILSLGACQTRQSQLAQDDESAWYIGAKADKPFDIPLVDTGRLDPKYRRQTVAYTGLEAPGTIVIVIRIKARPRVAASRS